MSKNNFNYDPPSETSKDGTRVELTHNHDSTIISIVDDKTGREIHSHRCSIRKSILSEINPYYDDYHQSDMAHYESMAEVDYAIRQSEINLKAEQEQRIAEEEEKEQRIIEEELEIEAEIEKENGFGQGYGYEYKWYFPNSD